ncbi:hypothetical protein [Lacticaseibacillus manihotivorans]|nr:hypothetical protein [Lacticaseibacillus manihotivorans]
MTYSIEHKTAFTILGFGRTVQYGEAPTSLPKSLAKNNNYGTTSTQTAV